MAELDKVFFVPGLDKIEVEVDMLDFSYIEKCNDWVKLLKIVETLKSGHEGHYPELTRAAEERMLAVMPTKERKRYRALNHVASPTEVAEAEEDLMNWLKQTTKIDQKLSKSKNTLDIYGNNASSSELSLPLKSMNKSQLNKIQDAATRLKVDSLTSLQRERKAEAERRKGNECFKSHDYDDAVKYYTDSIALFETVEATWTNRAIAYIKKELYDLAEADCNAALSLNPSSIKALTRRGLSRISQGRYKQAAYDFHTALTLEPSSAELAKLLDQALTKYKDTEGSELTLPSMKKQAKDQEHHHGDEFVHESKVQEEDTKNHKNYARIPSHSVQTFEDLLVPSGILEKISMGLITISEHVTEVEQGFVRIAIQEDDDDDEEDEETPSIPIEAEEEPTDEGFVRIPISTEDDDEEEEEDSEETVEVLTTEQKAQNLKDFGNQLMQKGDFQGALDAYNTSMALYPSILTQNNRAQAKLSLKDYEGALADSSAVLHEDPKNLKALFRRSKACYELEQYQQAYKDVTQILTVDPENAAAKKMQYDIEQVASAEVAKLNSEKSDTLKNQGNKAMETGKFAEAVELYTQALDIDEDNIAALNNRTLAFLKLKKFVDADKDATNVLRSAQELPSDLALTYKKKAYFRRAEARYNRGLELELNNIEKAVEFFRQARTDIVELLKIDPTGSGKAVKELQDMVNSSIAHAEDDIKDKKKSEKKVEKEVKKSKEPEKQEEKKSPSAPSSPLPSPSSPAPVTKTTVESTTTPLKAKDSSSVPATPSSTSSKQSKSATKSPRLKESIAVKVEAPTTTPKTLYEFERMWRGLQGHIDLRVQYLELFKRSTYKKVFKEAISSDLIGSIFQALNTSHCSASTAKKALEGLMEMKSFALTISLIPQEDIEMLKEVFVKLNANVEGEEGKKEIETLQHAFGVKL